MPHSQIVHIPAHLVSFYAITKRHVSKRDRKAARKMMQRPMRMAGLFRGDAADSLRAASANLTIACVHALQVKRSSGTDEYAVHELAAFKGNAIALLSDAKASRLDAARRGFTLP